MLRFWSVMHALVVVLWFLATAAMIAVPLHLIANGRSWWLGAGVLAGCLSGALLLVHVEGERREPWE